MTQASGRVALVTHATGAIGTAIAHALARQGSQIALHDGGDPMAAAALARVITADGGQAWPVAAAMGDALAVQRMVDEVYRAAGRLDVLVCVPPVPADRPLLTLAADGWEAAIAEVVSGTLYAMQAAARYMLLDRRGRMVVLTGLAGTRPGRSQVAAAAVQGALTAMMRAVAVELAPKQIAVNAVAPGAIVAAVGAPVASGPLDARGAGLAEERLLEQIPLHRLGRPEEVAGVVAFLAADRAAYVTGEVFYVDGGLGGRR